MGEVEAEAVVEEEGVKKTRTEQVSSGNLFIFEDFDMSIAHPG